MNPRIRQLAEQSGLPTALDYHQKRYEKFAELIVQECLDIINDEGDWAGGCIRAMKKIKEHFEVDN